MTVGALRDLGVAEDVFTSALDSLALGEEMHVHFSPTVRNNIAAVKFDVHAHAHAGSTHTHAHPHGGSEHVHGRSYRQITELLDRSKLSPAVKARATSVFHRIAVAEGRIHGVPPEEVGFHEVGAVDSLADIVAACAGIESLAPDEVHASPLVEGSGWIDCAHGRFPLPAPATLEILKGIPFRQTDEPLEFITPTGAALIAEYATRFGPLANMKVERTGFGAGTRDTAGRPNVLRAILGTTGDPDDSEHDEVAQIETNLDDITPELAAAAMQKLFAAGALDVFFTPVQMKKNRPGFVMTALCHPAKTDELAGILLRETSAFGVRIHSARRLKLRREFREVETAYGKVRIKLGFLGEDLVQAAPEFESCRAVAEAAGVSVRDVHLAAWISTMPAPVTDEGRSH